MARSRPAAVAIAWVLALSGCAGNPGRLANAVAPIHAFVHAHDPIYVATGGGLVRVDLDGRHRRRLASARYHLLSISDDGAVIAFGDDDTNLYVMHASDRKIVRVHALDGRAGAVALSPDGRVLAAARHVDFALPESEWEANEDDAVYLVDTTSLNVRRLAPEKKQLVTSLFFSKNGRFLWLGLMDFSHERIDLSTGRRRATGRTPPAPLSVPGDRAPVLCVRSGAKLRPRGFGGDHGLDLVARDGSVRRLVVVKDRRRGFHDYLPTIRAPFFSRSCRYVVFVFRGKVWVTEVATGKTGVLSSGGAPFTLPAAHPASSPTAMPMSAPTQASPTTMRTGVRQPEARPGAFCAGAAAGAAGRPGVVPPEASGA